MVSRTARVDVHLFYRYLGPLPDNQVSRPGSSAIFVRRAWQGDGKESGPERRCLHCQRVSQRLDGWQIRAESGDERRTAHAQGAGADARTDGPCALILTSTPVALHLRIAQRMHTL
jgi:hypothetical protein